METPDFETIDQRTPRWYLAFAIALLLLGLAGAGFFVWADWNKALAPTVDAHKYLGMLLIPGFLGLLVLLPNRKGEHAGLGGMALPVAIILGLACLWCLGFAAVESLYPDQIGGPRWSKREGGSFPHPETVRWEDLPLLIQVTVGVLAALPGVTACGIALGASWAAVSLFRSLRKLDRDLEDLVRDEPDAQELRAKLGSFGPRWFATALGALGICLLAVAWTIGGLWAINNPHAVTPTAVWVVGCVGLGSIVSAVLVMKARAWAGR